MGYSWQLTWKTFNHQGAEQALASQCDPIIVVGSPNSSNSNRLREVAQNLGVSAYMVDNAAELKAEWLPG
ncbi:hypothetical protein TPL01_23360 [Sulfuriferula plumbiphila]|uniref:4-hydroxy-3-methylbut-2-enyl diphosphate reductase n=1 Tax=Sulfuriferula plumbiphila TaxID=171865 RepID=A0A512L9N3_9PROT|nr:hypothetical protein SFPGR_11100 [Sulfuriferula plumbiphila]GEP31198.1 hypothetical protein TPL01_23360 [Sulfuriferula plumbiphila]